MSTFKLTIELDNSAFDGDDCGPELARILRDMADKVEDLPRRELGDYGSPPRDVNGNRVGQAWFEMDSIEDEEYLLDDVLDGRTKQELKEILTDVCGDVTFAEENYDMKVLRCRIFENVTDGTTTIDDIKEYLNV